MSRAKVVEKINATHSFRSDTLELLDAFVKRQPLRPSKSAVVDAAVRRFILDNLPVRDIR